MCYTSHKLGKKCVFLGHLSHHKWCRCLDLSTCYMSYDYFTTCCFRWMWIFFCYATFSPFHMPLHIILLVLFQVYHVVHSDIAFLWVLDPLKNSIHPHAIYSWSIALTILVFFPPPQFNHPMVMCPRDGMHRLKINSSFFVELSIISSLSASYLCYIRLVYFRVKDRYLRVSHISC